MSEYDQVRVGRLILKGEKPKSKKRKHKRKHTSSTADDAGGSSSPSSSSQSKKKQQKIDSSADCLAHGNWWQCTKIEDISGPVAIEFGKHTYVKALDTGLFTLGAPHDEGEGPAPEEILTAVAVNERKVAFKSGYGKYLRVEKNGMVTGRSDAIGAMEQWEPVFQDGKMALQSYSECFVSVRDEDDAVVALSKTAGPEQMLKIRSMTVKEVNPLKDVPSEEQGDLAQVEINYVKKFQKFQDKRLRICTEDRSSLKKAKEEGTFHETMLDRRSKMKADRYCK